jgi:spore germination protein KC
MSANVELKSGDLSLNQLKENEYNKLENEMEKDLKKELLKALRKTQQLQADVLQLGNRFEIYEPEKWKKLEPKWKDFYQNKVVFDVKINLHLKRIGEFTAPLWKAK